MSVGISVIRCMLRVCHIDTIRFVFNIPAERLKDQSIAYYNFVERMMCYTQGDRKTGRLDNTLFTLLHETEPGDASDHITLNFEQQYGIYLQIVVQEHV